MLIIYKHHIFIRNLLKNNHFQDNVFYIKNLPCIYRTHLINLIIFSPLIAPDVHNVSTGFQFPSVLQSSADLLHHWPTSLTELRGKNIHIIYRNNVTNM